VTFQCDHRSLRRALAGRGPSLICSSRSVFHSKDGNAVPPGRAHRTWTVKHGRKARKIERLLDIGRSDKVIGYCYISRG